MFKDMAHVS